MNKCNSVRNSVAEKVANAGLVFSFGLREQEILKRSLDLERLWAERMEEVPTVKPAAGLELMAV